MQVENPIAFSFIMQDDIYLLNDDKEQYSMPATLAPENAPLAEVAEIPPVVQPQAAAPEPVSFKYLGGHKKNFLVITHYAEFEFIADAHLTALQSVLGRLTYSMEDVAIFNLAKYNDAVFNELLAFFKPAKLLLLGDEALPSGIEKPALNTPIQLNNFPVLLSYSFHEMMDNNEKKKAFWEQMKQL